MDDKIKIATVIISMIILAMVAGKPGIGLVIGAGVIFAGAYFNRFALEKVLAGGGSPYLFGFFYFLKLGVAGLLIFWGMYAGVSPFFIAAGIAIGIILSFFITKKEDPEALTERR